ncbi:MAG: CRISPR-associated helicase Cas3' [Clostridiales bacterium]|nr:CRISPR-associated helicase Cas3' [Clostridiales bacterium]
MASDHFLAHVHEIYGNQTIKDHLNQTAELAASFAKSFDAEADGYYAGLMHDIGKYSDAFQRRIRGASIRTNHSNAGAKEAFQAKHPMAAFSIAGHHGGLPDGGHKSASNPNDGTLFGRMKEPAIPYQSWTDEITLPTHITPQAKGKGGFSDAFYTRMLYSCLVDADFLDTERFMNGGNVSRGGYAPLPELLRRLQEYIEPWWDAKSEINQNRCKILRRCLDQGAEAGEGLYTLTVPTGGGKTVASLAFALAHAIAQGKERIIYVVPYTSIIEQNAAVFQEILDAEQVIEHHSGAQYDISENDTDQRSYRKALATENWDAPVIVTTAVQFFESLYAARGSRCRKLHNLANAVIIFDEAQTIPVAHLRPCVAAISQLVMNYHTTAVLCTATQPALGELFHEFAPTIQMSEICDGVDAYFEYFRRNEVSDHGKLSMDVLAEELAGQNQALCIVNKRKTAQDLFARLCEARDSEGCYCLTTLIYPEHRSKKLAEIKDRLDNELPCIIISTSLIEAGVDIDLPVVYRELAGLDSILQAAGRCNREGKNPAQDSHVWIFQLEECKIPQMIRQNVDSTQRIMRIFEDITSPSAIKEYFSFYRSLLGDPSQTSAMDQAKVIKAFEKGIEGCCFPFRQVEKNFKLIENQTTAIYLPFGQGAELIKQLRCAEYDRMLFRKLGRYSVNVYPDHLQELLAAGAVECVDEQYILIDADAYDDTLGLKLDVESGKGWMI